MHGFSYHIKDLSPFIWSSKDEQYYTSPTHNATSEKASTLKLQVDNSACSFHAWQHWLNSCSYIGAAITLCLDVGGWRRQCSLAPVISSSLLWCDIVCYVMSCNYRVCVHVWSAAVHVQSPKCCILFLAVVPDFVSVSVHFTMTFTKWTYVQYWKTPWHNSCHYICESMYMYIPWHGDILYCRAHKPALALTSAIRMAVDR